MTNRSPFYRPKVKNSRVVERAVQLGITQSLSDTVTTLHCPFCNETAKYYHPRPESPIGCFSCTCRKKTSDFIRHLRLEHCDAHTNRDVIIYSPDAFGFCVDICINLLLETNAFFRIGPFLYQIRIENGVVVSLRITSELCRNILMTSAAWYRPHGDQTITPPLAIATELSQGSAVSQFPPLDTIAFSPTLDCQGRLIKTTGYMAETKVFFSFPLQEFADFPDITSREEALELLTSIKDEFRNFPFVSPHDRSAALALLFTAVQRAVLPTAPLFHIFGTEPGTGKTTLAKLALSLSVPSEEINRTSICSLPNSEEEMTKTLISNLSSGIQVVLFDNVTEDIQAYPSLCTVLTETTFADRLLRSNTICNVSTRCLFMSTGNGWRVLDDLCRRTITISLSSFSDSNFRREQSEDIVERFKKKRVAMVKNILRIVSSFEQSHVQLKSPNVSSYETWSRRCREPLIWLGEADPATSLLTSTAKAEAAENGPVQLFRALFDQVGNKKFSLRDLRLKDLKFPKDLAENESLLDFNGDISSRALGRWLARHHGLNAGKLTLLVERNSSRCKYHLRETT